MPASSYEVGIDEARSKLDLWARSKLDLWGASIVHQDLLELVTPEVTAAGAEYGRLKGYAQGC